MGTAIVITSGKGGTGKSTACAALAGALSQMGKRVLCVDCDVGLKNLDLQLGFSDAAPRDFASVLDGVLTPEEAVLEHPALPGLFFLTAPVDRRPEDISPEAMAAFIQAQKQQYDFVLTDSPAGLGAGYRLAMQGADMALVVTTGDASSLRDGQRVTAELRQRGLGEIRLLVNRVRRGILRRSGVNVDDMIDAVGARLIGLVGDDPVVSIAANQEIPLVLCPESRAAEQFRRVARRLCGEHVPLGAFIF